jgi:hypothetical protein
MKRGSVAPVVTANAVVAPDGTLTADQIAFGASTDSRVEQVVSGLTVAANYRFSVYLRVASGTATLRVGTSITAAGEFSDVTVTDQWQRFEHTTAASATDEFPLVANQGGSAVTVFVWGAQLELGSTATPYQRVGSTFDVTEAGQPDNFYLSFDGVDDFMQTPSIDFTGTNKMSIFAGVRKLSDAASASLAELSVNFSSNNGSFFLAAPANDATGNYGWNSKGTLGAVVRLEAATFSSPISNVVTGLTDFALSSRTIRVNGQQRGISTSALGSTNFGNYPMFIGSRAGTSVFFNGHLYSLIIRGALTDASAIERTEKYVANRTAGVNL